MNDCERTTWNVDSFVHHTHFNITEKDDFVTGPLTFCFACFQWRKWILPYLIRNSSPFNRAFSLDCTYFLTSEVGSITSPSYPSYYANNLHYRWLITAEPGTTIRLSFTRFNTEPCCDHLRVGLILKMIHSYLIHFTRYTMGLQKNIVCCWNVVALTA